MIARRKADELIEQFGKDKAYNITEHMIKEHLISYPSNYNIERFHYWTEVKVLISKDKSYCPGCSVRLILEGGKKKCAKCNFVLV